jgi:hypothetical protein
MTVGPPRPGGGFRAPPRMVTYNRIRVMIALTVAASFGWVTMSDRSLADEPRGSTALGAATSTPPERYLLLTNGQLIKGVISERETDYHVGQRVGAMSFPKRQVEGAFDSTADAYQYRVEQLPERDTEERMKLALWCLNLKLKAQAKEQLTKVVELNPRHTQAKAMLFSMQQSAEIASQRQRDTEVQQTAAETSREGRPGALDSAVIQNAQRGLGVRGLPVIFDLPAPLAVKRANEYFRLVHPLLQAYCAKCHDGNYDGEFQLISTKNRADRNPDALRANLDATLRLIDRANLSNSELLSSTLRAHGRGPHPRPVFTGSNDKSYQAISAWVQSLRDTKNSGEPMRAESARGANENAELFAAGRGAITSDSRQPALVEPRGGIAPPPPSAGNEPTTNHIVPPLRYRGTVDLSEHNGNSPDPRELEFPLPPVIGGFKAPVPAAGGLPKKDARKTSQPAGKMDPSLTANSPSATAAAGKSSSPEDAAKSASQAKAANEAGAPKKKIKPVTIDPTLLERALLNRNSGQ